MKQFMSAVRLALYMVAIPLTITAAASAHQWFATAKPAAEAKVNATHIVRLTESGMVRGSIKTFDANGQKVVVAHANASLIKDGELVTKVRTGIDGLFSISNVEPGIYTFVSASNKGIATFGMEVVKHDSEAGVSALSVLAAPPRFNSLETIVKGLSDAPVNSIAKSEEVIGGVQQVRLTLAGALVGNVDALNGINQNNKVSLIRNDEVVGEAKVVDGQFEIADVAPGVYTFVAHGDGGLATVAMEVVPADYQANNNGSTVYTALQDCCGCCDSVAISMAPVCETIISEEIVISEGVCAPTQEVVCEEIVTPCDPIAAAPIAGGCGCGGYGGYGGGGGFGGGGLGANLGGIGNLIGLGIGAWALTEIIDTIDNNNNRIPTPVPVPNPPTPISGYTYIYL